MQTRKALEKLSKGDKVYQDRANSSLLEQGKRFIDMYDAKEREILAAKSQDVVPLPFLEAVKRKVAKMVEKPNDELPVVTRFDLYTGIRKMSERAPADAGLKRLAAQLERAWHIEPLGALNYGDVSGLIKVYKDQFPRSKAADAVEAECARVGLHKLPVAKLARIAANINSQTDYDAAIDANGFAGDRIEQVRARTLIRELVALRSVAVCSTDPVESDNRTTEERVFAGIELRAQMAPPLPGTEEHEMLETPEEEMMEQETGMEALPPVAPPAGEAPEMAESGADIVQQIQDVAEDIMVEAPPEAQSYIEHEMAEGHTAPVGTAEWGAEEILNEGHEAPPPTEEWLMEEMEELGGEMPGLDAPEMPAMEASEDPMAHDADEHEGQRNFMVEREKNQLGNQKYMDSRRGPADQFDFELLKDMGYSDADYAQMVKMILADPENPLYAELRTAMALKAAKGKGIPLPNSKIKEQPNAKNALDSVPEDGGKALKAAQIENALLDGQMVRSASGDVKIFINSDDEVELWNKAAGRVCELEHLDVAIADFINMNNYAKAAAKRSASRRLVSVVDVPCEMCANITKFELSASRKDFYGCDCGHEISAAAVLDLVAAGLLKTAQQFDMDQPAQLSDADYDNLAKKIVQKGGSDQDLTRACLKVNEWNNAVDPQKLHDVVMNMTSYNGTPVHNIEGKKAQMAAPAPAMPAPGAPTAPAAPAQAAPAGEEQEAVTDMPLDEVIKGAFVNYKAQGMKLPEALRTFMKEHGDLMESGRWNPEADAMLVAMQTQYYTAAVPAPAPVAAPAAPAAPAPMPMAAQKVLEPSVKKKMKDMVNVGAKPLGKDHSQDDGIPSPGKIKNQPNKNPQGNFSNKEMGKDTSSQEWTVPSTAKSSPNKGKLPNKKMDSDSEGDEPFKTPGLGSKPSVSKK